MIIWINGTYGVGKTTVANTVDKIYSGNSKVLEPDKLWFSFLSSGFRGGGTYPQANKNFIDFFKVQINEIVSNYEGLIIIPMTLTEQLSYNTLIKTNQNKIKQFILEANENIIRERINKDKNRDKNLATYSMKGNIDFLNKISDAIHIDTSNMTSDEVANYIISKI